MERYQLTVGQEPDLREIVAGAARAEGLAMAIGFFDGIHVGHQEVIRQTMARAKEKGLTAAVMTFDPHPRMVLGKGDRYSEMLTPLTHKLALLEDLGIEVVYIIHFNNTFSQLTDQQFVNELLIPLGVKSVTVGYDFRFGHCGQGDAEALQRYADGNMDVQIVRPISQEEVKISSSRIRELLAAGECHTAARLLGRPYEVRGTVVHGDARGRLLGYPTANLQLEQPYVIPRSGVYAIEVKVLSDDDQFEQIYRGVLNIGTRPTFHQPGGELKLEAHLFDFDGDLYGKRLGLSLYAFLRPEMKFDGVERLVAQIAADAEQARSLLASGTFEYS